MSTIKVDTVRPVTADASLTLQGDSGGSGVTGLTIDSNGVFNTTTAKVTNIQAKSGQSLTIKDEDGNTAISIGTDNTAASYLTLNFGSYHGDSAAAGSGSLTANTLDDYEQGSFVPAYKASGTDPTVSSYSFSEGFYIKIGKLVHINLRIRGNITSVGSGNALLGGLPFTVDSTTGSTTAFVVGYYENWTTNGPTFAIGSTDTTDIALFRDNGASGTSITVSNYKTGNSDYNEVYVAGTYITN